MLRCVAHGLQNGSDARKSRLHVSTKGIDLVGQLAYRRKQLIRTLLKAVIIKLGVNYQSAIYIVSHFLYLLPILLRVSYKGLA